MEKDNKKINDNNNKKQNKQGKIIISLVCVAVVLAAIVVGVCVSNKNKDDGNSQTNTASQSQVSESTTDSGDVTSSTTTPSTSTDSEEQSTDAGTTESTQAATQGDSLKPISVNQALNVLDDFYGKTYEVNATIVEDGYQYFAVFDKKGTKYASVKVNLSTSQAYETILETGEVNEFNLSDD